jgi:hypothetical protein
MTERPLGRDGLIWEVRRTLDESYTCGREEGQGRISINSGCPYIFGGGRKRLTETDPQLNEELDRLVAPLTRGDPQSPLRWTCKSTSHLAQELSQQGHPISARTVAQLLNASGYSLQSNRKTLEGSTHPDRNTQFEYINAQVKRFQQRGQPVMSVDTKKKELVGP